MRRTWKAFLGGAERMNQGTGLGQDWGCGDAVKGQFRPGERGLWCKA